MSFIVTPPGRLAFVHLAKPWAGPKNDQDPKYMVNLIIPPAGQKSPEFQALKKGVVEAAKAKFGDDVDMKALKYLPFSKGEDYDYEGFNQGDVVIKPRSTERPGVVDAAGQEIMDLSDVYAGCWARLSVRPYAFSNSGNTGVSIGLEHVQFLRDGDRLDGRVSPQAAFGDSLPEGFEIEKDPVADEIPF